jgi:hypothetical protein
VAEKKSTAARVKTVVNWRKVSIIALASLGVLFLTGFTISHWTHRQILTTDNYVELVGPLPKDPSVSAAIADLSVNKLFETIDLQAKITEVLPPPAAFLAPALTEQIDLRATNVTQKLIQSDQFQGIWIAANRAAHQRLMDYARDSGSDTNDGDNRTKLSIRLEGLLSMVKERLGSTSQSLFGSSGQPSESVDVAPDLKTSLSTFKRGVQAVDFLNSTLLLASLACLVGALALSYTKRRLLMIILAAISLISLLQLIGVKVVRPEIVNLVEQESYRPAAGYIYDQLVLSFKNSATTLFWVSTTLLAFIWLTQTRLVRRNSYLKSRIRELKASRLWGNLRQLRRELYRYRWLTAGLLAGLLLIVMAFAVASLDWTAMFAAGLLVLLIIGLIHLAALNPSAKRR